MLKYIYIIYILSSVLRMMQYILTKLHFGNIYIYMYIYNIYTAYVKKNIGGLT